MQGAKINSFSLDKRFQIQLADNFSFLKEKKLLLAISGGIDSMVLCRLMNQSGLEFSLAHCNFKLRGDASDKDEAFVKLEAEQLKKQLYLIHFDTETYARKHKLSIQMAARELRYCWFDKIMLEKGYDFLITAHHADDSLETFIINLSRGTGLDGLTGIPERAGKTIRPLLIFTKKEIELYARENHISWREDLSNENTKYLRNKIRKELVPVLKALNPNFLDSFYTTLMNLKGEQQIIEDRMRHLLDEAIEPSTGAHQQVVKFKVSSLIPVLTNTAYLHRIFHPYGFNQWKDIASLLKAQSGKQVLSKTHRLVKHGNHLLLDRIPDLTVVLKNLKVNEGQQLLIIDHSEIHFQSSLANDQEKSNSANENVKTALFDQDLLHYPLTVRKWEKGDYFYPKGMIGKKKLSKFFKDEKFSLLQKENIWLLCSGNDIIWIIGKRMDNRYKITENTQNILKAVQQA